MRTAPLRGRSPSASLGHTGKLSLSQVAVVLFVASVPLEQSVLIPGVGSITTVTGVLAVLALLGSLGSRQQRLRKPGLVVLLLAIFGAWSVATGMWSQNFSSTLIRAETYVQLVAMGFLVHAVIRRIEERDWVLQGFVVGVAGLGANVMINFTSGQQAGASLAVLRYSSEGANPNRVGVILAIGMVMAWHLCTRPRPTAFRALNLTLIVTTPLLILLTASRAAFLAAAVVSVIMLGGSLPTGSRRRTAALVTVAGLMIVISMDIVPATSIDRLQTLYEDPAEQSSAGKRLAALNGGLALIAQHPFVGVGAGAYATAVAQYAGFEIVAHNTLVSIFAETGLVGLLIFGGLTGTYLRGAFSRQPDRLFLLALFGAWFIGASFASWEHDKVTWVVLVLGGLPKLTMCADSKAVSARGSAGIQLPQR